MTTAPQSRRAFTAEAIRGSDTGYTAFHAPRFAYLIEVLERIGVNERTRILDIGKSKLTDLIRERFNVPVDTLGFPPDEQSATGNHFRFDLNDSQDRSRWRRDIPKYDVVVLAEVIEHLYTAPELVLAFLRELLVPGGSMIVQTPNAAAATRRIKLMLGRNPYEMIRVDNTNPGHFREYTVPELRRLVTGAGYDVLSCETRYYFDARFAHHGENPRYDPIVGRIKNFVFPLLPSSMRLGTTMVVKLR